MKKLHGVRGRMRPTSWRRESAWPLPGESQWLDHETAGPQTEDSEEQGFAVEPSATDWGRSDSVDPDGVGDIADEGTGRRG
jgi:hypothetical protein